MQLATAGMADSGAENFFISLTPHLDLPPWLSGLAISGRGAVKAWLAIWQGVGLYPTPAGMSS